MTEKEIFEHIIALIPSSEDNQGVVGACLVRDGKIIQAGVSMVGGAHAEYCVLEVLKEKGFVIDDHDIFYTTVEPCGKRTPGGRGEKMGDCTTNLINAGVKKVVYAAKDPDASDSTRHKFEMAGVILEQTLDKEVISKSVEAFNATCDDHDHWLPVQ